jgi:hypothetical protein
MTDMHDPPRLRSQLSPGSVLARGLEAANQTGPTDQQLRLLESSLVGLGAAAMVAPVAKSSLVSGGSWLSATATKVLLAGVGLATIGTGAVTAAHVLSRTRAAQTRPPQTRAEPSRARAIVLPLPDDPGETLASAPETPVPAAQRPAAHPIRNVTRPSVQNVARSLDDETTLLDRANRALASDPGLALALIDEHGKQFSDASLAEERELLGVRALLGLGRRQEARERIAKFLRTYPQSAYRSRVEQLKEP